MKRQKAPILSNGFAMFSMFFGAGNITFPLAIGLAVRGNILLALLGLTCTAVMIPFAGLLATTLFKGDYTAFFRRMGPLPGFLVIALLIALIGPFGALPRCITLTYSTLHIYFSSLELSSFSLIAAGVVFLFACKRGRIVDLIGYILTPLLLLFLFAIVIKGLFFSNAPPPPVGEPLATPFWYGLKEGYNTMDLLASFFFASLIYHRFTLSLGHLDGEKRLFLPVLRSCFIGALLLAAVYIGFSFVADRYSGDLVGTPLDELLGRIGHLVLGKQAGLVVCMSIALACLTTAIALAVISAEFLQREVLRHKVRYDYCLIIVLVISYGIATLGFTGIVAILAPVLEVIYPALLVLSLMNILHKLFGIKIVKTPVYATILFVFARQLFNL